jgi:hypothetical protein
VVQGGLFPVSEECPTCQVPAVRHPGRLWQCPRCALVFSAFRPWDREQDRAPDLVTWSDAVRDLGREGASMAPGYRFHHTDDRGKPYWTREEYERVLGLLEIEHPPLVTHRHSSNEDVRRRKGPRPAATGPGPVVDTSSTGPTHVL